MDTAFSSYRYVANLKNYIRYTFLYSKLNIIHAGGVPAPRQAFEMSVSCFRCRREDCYFWLFYWMSELKYIKSQYTRTNLRSGTMHCLFLSKKTFNEHGISIICESSSVSYLSQIYFQVRILCSVVAPRAARVALYIWKDLSITDPPCTTRAHELFLFFILLKFNEN